MDAKFYFASSLVVIELLRLFKGTSDRDKDNNRSQKKLQHERNLSVEDAEDREVAALVNDLQVLAHPEGTWWRW